MLAERTRHIIIHVAYILLFQKRAANQGRRANTASPLRGGGSGPGAGDLIEPEGRNGAYKPANRAVFGTEKAENRSQSSTMKQ